MLKLQAAFAVVVFCLWVYCLVQAISASEDRVRHLPKIGWILLVLLFPLVGSLAWLLVGQPVADRPRPGERSVPSYPEYDRPGRAAATDSAGDEAFLEQVRERAEQQRRAYREQQAAEQARIRAAADERRRRAAERARAEGASPERASEPASGSASESAGAAEPEPEAG